MKAKFTGVFTQNRFSTKGEWQEFIKKVEGRTVEVSIETLDTRSNLQNRAIHKFCQNIANELNGVGVQCQTISIINGKTLSRMWTMELVKENIWRPVQIAIAQAQSTTQIKTDQVDKIATPILKFLKDNYDIGLLFPSQLAKAMEEGRLDY